MLRALLIAAVLATPVAAQERTPRISNNVAVFSGLDKITGRITEFDVWIGETVQFGVLQVTPRVCYSRPKTERPKTTSFIEIDEVTLDRKMRRIFSGWMLAESPGLNAVEHSVNDVWLKACRQTSAVAAPPGFVMRSNEPVAEPESDAPRAGEGTADDEDATALPDEGEPIPDAPAGADADGRPQTLEEFLALPDEPLDQ